MADDRKRDWLMEVYPDSAPENWKQIMDWDMGLTFAVSPLHDQDRYDNPRKLPLGAKLGEFKKPHYHVIVTFLGKKSFEFMKCIADQLGQPFPIPCVNKRKALRYFTHIDNPEKAPYNREDIELYGGFDLSDAYKPVGSDIDRILRELKQFILDSHIYEYAEFIEALDEVDNDDWNYVATRCCSGFFKGYMQSRYLRLKDQLREMEDDL